MVLARKKDTMKLIIPYSIVSDKLILLVMATLFNKMLFMFHGLVKLKTCN